MKVFISGPMTGIDDYNRPLFNEAEKKLREMGYDVFNPAWMQFGDEWDKNDIMAIDLMALSRCEAICHLTLWTFSKGAILENHVADYADKIHLGYADGEIVDFGKNYITSKLTVEDMKKGVNIHDKN